MWVVVRPWLKEPLEKHESHGREPPTGTRNVILGPSRAETRWYPQGRRYLPPGALRGQALPHTEPPTICMPLPMESSFLVHQSGRFPGHFLEQAF